MKLSEKDFGKYFAVNLIRVPNSKIDWINNVQKLKLTGNCTISSEFLFIDWAGNQRSYLDKHVLCEWSSEKRKLAIQAQKEKEKNLKEIILICEDLLQENSIKYYKRNKQLVFNPNDFLKLVASIKQSLNFK